MFTTALLPCLSAPDEPIHAQPFPAVTDMAPLLVTVLELQDE